MAQVQIVLGSLGKIPLEVSYDAFDTIKKQVETQMTAERPQRRSTQAPHEASAPKQPFVHEPPAAVVIPERPAAEV